MSRAESVIEQKEYALTIFLDIEGAFNKTSLDGVYGAIEEPALKHPSSDGLGSCWAF